MEAHKNLIIKGSKGRNILLDVFFLHTTQPKPVIIYAHGFNGFKDWGNFDLIAKHFASAGFVFVKFNFSHNGTTTDEPEAFVDLDAYSNNNYTTELEDLQRVIEWIIGENDFSQQTDANRLGLLGHSMGGGISIIKASEEERIKALATWASIAECQTPWGSWPSEKIKKWIDTGIQYITNTRTGQEMPLKYQLFEDYQNNKDRLNIEAAAGRLIIPFLICHGLNDSSVPVEKAYLLHQWNARSELFLVEGDHVFGRKHPWNESTLPQPMQLVLEKTVDFYTANL